MEHDSSISKKDVTYELFDLNPSEYYEERFAYIPVRAIVANETKAVQHTLIYQKSASLHDALRTYIAEVNPQAPVKVLEVGCGSGTIGARLKSIFPDILLYGVDMSATCIETAKLNGYDHVLAHNVVTNLPYDDNLFDFIYTMDFFGHVEFKDKDQIIHEMNRITKPGGHGYHGIEMGYIDYLNCDPKNPEDLVRKYVYMEGHIGVETLDDILERFTPYYEIIQAYPWPIRPMINIDNILKSKFWGESFCEAFEEHNNFSSQIAADMVIGWINQFLLNNLREIFGNILTTSNLTPTHNPKLNHFIDSLLQGCGFAIVTVRKAHALTG
ncbi:class I SAM-dependent methyltransferase [Paenibacillus sp. KN14-4R]|uniref:class I SAM-dependent methyltransferase n=1 Tax=Paenibacillus sp. KN14-4R TaxID=3445773 RepID=UPI003FA1478E